MNTGANTAVKKKRLLEGKENPEGQAPPGDGRSCIFLLFKLHSNQHFNIIGDGAAVRFGGSLQLCLELWGDSDSETFGMVSAARQGALQGVYQPCRMKPSKPASFSRRSIFSAFSRTAKAPTWTR